jgi:protein-disulfide isomerase
MPGQQPPFPQQQPFGYPPPPGYPPQPGFPAPKKSNTGLIVTLVVVAVLAVLCCAGTIVGLFVVRNEVHTSSSSSSSEVEPKRVAPDGTGIVVSEGPVRVELYVDLQCPACRQFEQDAGETLSQYATAKKIELTVHLLTFLDRMSPNQYSSRAAAATVCAAEDSKLLEYSAALFENQPEEGSPGPTDDQLIATGKTLGLGDSFATCVSDKKYLSWVKSASTKALDGGIQSVPTVVVAGRTIDATKQGLVSAVGS